MKKGLWMFWVTLKWTLAFLIVCGFGLGGLTFGYLSALVKDDPVRPHAEMQAKMEENVTTGFVYFGDDSMVGQLRGIDRRLATMDEIPSIVIDAFLATEDNDFYEHIGVDWRGTLRAVKERLLNEDIQTGGSTITQQVARNVFLTLEVSTDRKLKEMLLAMRLERHFSKQQILLAYLNLVPFGNGSSGYNVYGIKAAAQGIFDIDPNRLSDMNIAQAAYLAGLPKNPPEYSAFDGYGQFSERGFNNAMNRQRVVLRRMLEEKKITSQQYEEALAFDIRASLAQPRKKAYSTYPYLMQEVEKRAAILLLKQKHPDMTEADFRKSENQQLIANQIEDMLGRGYKIYTTIDKDIYESMQQIAANPENFAPDNIEDKGVEQIGAVILENKTGKILGMMEGRGFHISEFNHATQMIRQPGSTMKTLAAYLPAIEQGLGPGSVIDDLPLIMEDGSKGYHIPNNWNNRFHGLMTARTALNQSYNIPALDLFNNVVGIEHAWDFVKQLGITTLSEQDNYARTGVIGGLEHGVTVEEITGAYAAIPNGGMFADPYLIRRIEDSQGQIVYEHNEAPRQVFSKETAYLTIDMLRTVIENGTGSRIKREFKNYGKIPVSGKTGSTQLDRDAWFVGFSPDITVGVWAGYDKNHTLTQRLNEPQGPGTQRAMNIWSRIMDQAIELHPDWFTTEKFERPEQIVSKSVSSITGKLPSARVSEAGRTHSDLFNQQHLPTEVDDSMDTYKYVTYKGLNYYPQEGTPSDMVREGVLFKRSKSVTELYTNLENILNQLPNNLKPRKGSRAMTIADYYVPDLARTAPEAVDPRTDDGNPPAPPSNVQVTVIADGTAKINFQASGSQDVVGYRLYRSFNGSPYEHKTSVLDGEDLVAIDYFSNQYAYAYYVTAVDVAGKESQPSSIVTLNGTGTAPAPGSPSVETPPADGDSTDLGDLFPGDLIDGGGQQIEEEPSEPTAPRNVGAESVQDGSAVRLSWSSNPASEGIIRYDVYYSETEQGEYRKIGSSNTTRFTYTNAPLTGYYAVTAVTGRSESPRSSPAYFAETNE
ncbi:carboxypeptidase [Xylanibacillus composti]|nr:carboxypeptidase [Xylanibacillus composti]